MMSVNIEIKDKVKQVKSCKDGNHTFIPATWKISASTHVCTLFVCQHCLISADKTELEVMNCNHTADLKAKKAKAESSRTS